MRMVLLISLALILERGQPLAQQKSLAQFKNYFVTTIFRGNPAAAKLSSRTAKLYRTRLREGAKRGPNFAGHYTIVEWGCGSGCTSLAIVDAETGEVWLPPEVKVVTTLYTQQEEALKFRLDSRLLIVVGRRNFEGWEGISFAKYYYEWSNDKLRLIRSIVKKNKNARI